MKNKKGFEMPLNTILLVVLAFLALVVVSTYVFRGFGTAGAGVSDVGEGAGEQAEELTPGEMAEKAVYGGICRGTLSTGAETCGYYHDDSYVSGPVSTCSISSCRKINAVIYNLEDEFGTCSYGGDTDAVCVESCSDLTSVGKSACVCAGCEWLT